MSFDELPGSTRSIISAYMMPSAPTGNSSAHFAVKAFAKFFLTEPVGADGIIYAEMIDLVEPGNSSKDIVRDQVQLYR